MVIEREAADMMAELGEAYAEYTISAPMFVLVLVK